MDGATGREGHGGVEYEPVVEIGDTRFHVGCMPKGDAVVYDVSSEEGHLLARLSRANDVDSAPWTVERWTDDLDARTAQDIVRVAFERQLVSGHTGTVKGNLVSVEKGFASIELATGSEVWVPCGSFTAELVARARLTRGERAVTVDMLDGVPVRFTPREASLAPPSHVAKRAGVFETPALRMRRSG